MKIAKIQNEGSLKQVGSCTVWTVPRTLRPCCALILPILTVASPHRVHLVMMTICCGTLVYRELISAPRWRNHHLPVLRGSG